jgi:protein required for attachment to host cells
METWIVIADETQASVVVRSTYGPFYKIETWRRSGYSADYFARQIAQRLVELQGHFDELVVAAPPAVLDRLRQALPSGLAVKVSAQYPRYLTQLSQRELGQELGQLCPA